MNALLHEALPRFIVQAVIIIGLARLVGLGARRLRQPMVIAEIVAGIALGPSLLGWLLPEVAAALFPRSSMSLLGLMSQVGLVLFMFLVGLEFDHKLLRGRGHTSVVISHSSIIAPFALGALAALYLYPRLSDPAVPFSSFTLFMGVAMSITAFPVLARILVEHRLLRSKVGAVTITCAAVDDVTAWCILAFVVSLVRSTGVMDAVRTTVLALAYIAAMMLLVRPFLQRLGERGFIRADLSQNVVALTLVVLLLSSLATELIGIHALFGAFLAGAVTPKEHGFAQGLANKLEDLVVVFLLPLFFAYSGLRTQIGLLDTPEAWAMCGLIVLVACVGKFGGSAIAARLTGLRWREASALGILMNTRGLMELIVLNIGLDLGVITPTLFAMMVIMALVTTFITSPLLEWIYPMSELEKELVTTDDPAPPALSPGFTVLACVSYERSGPAMVTLAGALSGPTSEGSRIYALQLVPPGDRDSVVLGPQQEDPAIALGPVIEHARATQLEVRPLSFVSPSPAQDICSVAAVKRADFILLGWHKPLLGGTVLGGTVHDVMGRARADVGVLVDRGLKKITRVLVPYLGSVHDRAALRLSQRLVKHAGAAVTILHVVKPEQGSERLGVQAKMQEVFQEEGSEGPSPVTFKVVESASRVEAAIEESAAGYDLVIVGVGTEWGLEHRLFGLKPELLVQRCPTSLLVVRQHEPRKEAASPVAQGAGAVPRVAHASMPGS